MKFTETPLHNVTRVEVTNYEDQKEVDIIVGNDTFGVSVDSIQFDEPDRVFLGVHRDSDIQVEFDEAMCTVNEIDGHRQLRCQAWRDR